MPLQKSRSFAPFPRRRLLPVTAAIPVFLATAITGCGDNRGTEPEVTEPRVLTEVVLDPAAPTLDPGAVEQLLVLPRDQRHDLMIADDIRYYSSAEDVAWVSRSGHLISLRPGSATIIATVRVGATIRTASATVTVRDAPPAVDALLRLGPAGWVVNNGPVHVAKGATVQWVSNPSSQSGLYLLDENFDIIETLDFSNGFVRRTLDKPGIVRFCSRACWDPPDFGLIYVD